MKTICRLICNMGCRAIDLRGKKVGRLIVVCRAYDIDTPHARWYCDCDCGKSIIVWGYNLRSGNTRSCGCLRKEISKRTIVNHNLSHGQSRTRLYRIWASMKNLCRNKKHKDYPYYGGRGITYCDEWEKFLPFMEWAVANGYSDKVDLSLIDRDKNYCPENCKWTTAKERANSRSNSLRYKVAGGKYTLSQLSDMYGISRDVLYGRVMKMEWDIEKAIAVPVRFKRRKR